MSSLLSNGFHHDGLGNGDNGREISSHSIGRAFESQIRPLINIIDQLRATGVEKDVDLPTIAVMGDQSSGKSSVLEAISGIPLPRGSEIVTRCALEMRMEKASTWAGEICFTPSNQPTVRWKLNNSDEVPSYIEQATNMLAGPGKNVTDRIITMQIRSPDAPDLTLIDLPGIVHSVERHQSEAIIKCVENLIKKYMQQPRTIMLCLRPANMETANCVVFRMAHEHDPEARRTIGVVTKPDLVVDKEQKLKICKTICSGEIYNIKDFFIVRSRTPSEIESKLPRSALLQREAEFFETDEVYRRIDPTMRGFPSLITALTRKLVKSIQEVLPGLRTEIATMLRTTQLDFANLPPPPPSTEVGKQVLLNRLFHNYISDVREALQKGESPCEWSNTSDGKSRPSTMFAIWREKFDNFMAEIELHTKNKLSSRGEWREEKLLPYIQSQRGEELSMFANFNAFKRLILEHLENYKLEAKECLNALFDDLRQFIEAYTKKHFSSMNQLYSAVLAIADETSLECLKMAQERIDFLFRMEQHVFCQDKTVFKLLKMEKELEAARKTLCDRQNSPMVPLPVKKVIETLSNDEDNRAQMAIQMQEMLKIYFQAANPRLADNVPAAIRICLHLDYEKTLSEKLLSATLDTQMQDVLSADDPNEDHRINLEKKVKRLEEAQKLLREFKLPSK